MKLFEPEDSGIIFGGKRCNKSRHMVLMMKTAYDLGFQVYSNMSLKFPAVKLNSRDADKFLNELVNLVDYRFKNRIFNPVFLGIDEFQNIIHAQDFKKGTPYAKMLNQLGKVGITTYCTVPNFDQIYNVYRINCNKRIICKKITDNKYYVIYQKQSDIYSDQYDVIWRKTFDGSSVNELYDYREVMYI